MGSSKDRPKIGVSACLLGQAVRYDGREKQHPAINQLSPLFELVPLCPEVGAGLGVPRPPVQLVKREGALFALGIANRELDVTMQLNGYLESQLELISRLSGIILKARSPSCGVHSTPLFNFFAEEIGRGSGLFAAGLQKQFQSLPLIDEEQFEKLSVRERFLTDVTTYAHSGRLYNQLSKITK